MSGARRWQRAREVREYQRIRTNGREGRGKRTGKSSYAHITVCIFADTCTFAPRILKEDDYLHRDTSSLSRLVYLLIYFPVLRVYRPFLATLLCLSLHFFSFLFFSSSLLLRPAGWTRLLEGKFLPSVEDQTGVEISEFHRNRKTDREKLTTVSGTETLLAGTAWWTSRRLFSTSLNETRWNFWENTRQTSCWNIFIDATGWVVSKLGQILMANVGNLRNKCSSEKSSKKLNRSHRFHESRLFLSKYRWMKVNITLKRTKESDPYPGSLITGLKTGSRWRVHLMPLLINYVGSLRENSSRASEQRFYPLLCYDW